MLCLFDYLGWEGGRHTWHPDGLVIEVATSLDILDRFRRDVMVKRRLLPDNVRLRAYRTQNGWPHF